MFIYYCVLFCSSLTNVFMPKPYFLKLLCNPLNLLSVATVHTSMGPSTETSATGQWPQPQEKFILPLLIAWVP